MRYRGGAIDNQWPRQRHLPFYFWPLKATISRSCQRKPSVIDDFAYPYSRIYALKNGQFSTVTTSCNWLPTIVSVAVAPRAGLQHTTKRQPWKGMFLYPWLQLFREGARSANTCRNIVYIYIDVLQTGTRRRALLCERNVIEGLYSVNNSCKYTGASPCNEW